MTRSNKQSSSFKSYGAFACLALLLLQCLSPFPTVRADHNEGKLQTFRVHLFVQETNKPGSRARQNFNDNRAFPLQSFTLKFGTTNKSSTNFAIVFNGFKVGAAAAASNNMKKLLFNGVHLLTV